MKPDGKTLILPILLVTIGIGWLLTTLGVAPGVDWVWTLGLAVVGLMTFVVGGLDKVTFVVGIFFIVASCSSLLRQTGRLELDIEVPILVIVAGVLLLVARSRLIPMPSWVIEPAKSQDPPND
jgi:hypothetical protein